MQARRPTFHAPPERRRPQRVGREATAISHDATREAREDPSRDHRAKAAHRCRASRKATIAPMKPTGRFAPSPTGPLHLGSLVAAVGSWLYARREGGRWLVRMEDLDTPRVIAGSADEILRALERYGPTWDGEGVYQSPRIALYGDAL